MTRVDDRDAVINGRFHVMIAHVARDNAIDVALAQNPFNRAAAGAAAHRASPHRHGGTPGVYEKRESEPLAYTMKKIIERNGGNELSANPKTVFLSPVSPRPVRFHQEFHFGQTDRRAQPIKVYLVQVGVRGIQAYAALDESEHQLGLRLAAR